MRYVIENHSITFYLDNPKRALATIASQSFDKSGLTEQQVAQLGESLVKKFRGHRLGSQMQVTSSILRPIFSYFRTSGRAWPTTSADWQITVYSFFQFYLTDTEWSQGKTKLRIRQWTTLISGVLEFFKDNEVIPRDVIIPKPNARKNKSFASNQPLLGEADTKLIHSEIQPQKLLVDISIGMNDDDYLKVVEKQCRHIVNVVRDICLIHWNGLMQDAATGRRLAEQITDNEIGEAIAANKFGICRTKGQKGYLYTSPRHHEGHIWALALVRHILETGTGVDCVSIRTLRSSPFFRNDSFGHRKDSYTTLGNLTALEQEAWKTLKIPQQFYRFAGFLSHIDAAAACCLLTIEHPEFTSESLQDAKILNVHGKSYLLLTDSDGRSILSIDKPRAGKRKSVSLTPLAQTIVMDILRSTAPVRQVLRRSGDKTWRYLFLGVKLYDGGAGNLGVVEGKALYLTGGQGSIALTSLYPALSQNGLTKGTFDYRRLRNTMGVIRWFETGSIAEMSRRLGNTRKVSIKHYLPPALLHAWNTRIIRRFQNTLILLAAHDEPYLLEVSDFTNMAELQAFIAQLILDYPENTSPIGDEVQKRLASRQPTEVTALISTPGLLNVRLSPHSLGLLYAYSNIAQQTLTEDELDKVDSLSGLAPKQFIDLTMLIRHAAEQDDIHAALQESLNVPLLKQIHGKALALQIGLNARFARLALKNRWQ